MLIRHRSWLFSPFHLKLSILRSRAVRTTLIWTRQIEKLILPPCFSLVLNCSNLVLSHCADTLKVVGFWLIHTSLSISSYSLSHSLSIFFFFFYPMTHHISTYLSSLLIYHLMCLIKVWMNLWMLSSVLVKKRKICVNISITHNLRDSIWKKSAKIKKSECMKIKWKRSWGTYELDRGDTMIDFWRM